MEDYSSKSKSNHSKSLTPSSIKKKNQLTRLARYTANQKTKQSVHFTINNGESLLSNQVSGQRRKQDEMPFDTHDPNDYSYYSNQLASYQEQILNLNQQLNAIKNNLLLNSKALLVLEQEHLQETLSSEDKTQQELLRHQISLNKHNQFMKEQFERIKAKEKAQFL